MRRPSRSARFLKGSGLAIFVVIVATLALGQHGTAPSGYYPRSYNGDTFTGKVVGRDLDADTVTLEYQKGKKKENFTVKLGQGCNVPSRTGSPMHARDIPEGTIMTAFYAPQSETVAGEKRKTYVVIAVSFIEWLGKTVSEDKRRVFNCGEPSYTTFQVY